MLTSFIGSPLVARIEVDKQRVGARQGPRWPRISGWAASQIMCTNLPGGDWRLNDQKRWPREEDVGDEDEEEDEDDEGKRQLILHNPYTKTALSLHLMILNRSMR